MYTGIIIFNITIYEEKETMKILVWDIETLKRMFLVIIYNPQEKRSYQFEVSSQYNQLEALARFIDEYQDYYWVSYNGIRFDHQVVEWILHNYERWVDKGWEEICELIHQKAQDVIDDSNYDVFPEYREENFSMLAIDVFKVAHFDNRNRMVSLKRLQFEMDFPNVEEMPIAHDKDALTDDEMKLTREYCKNDVLSTYQFLKIMMGDTEHPLYKGNNQIQLRFDIQEEFGIKCLNYSDSKIGDEIIKKYYCEETRIEYGNLPKKGTFRKQIYVKNCIAPYIKFQTPVLNFFLKRIKRMSFGQKDDFKESIKFYGNTYSFMRGGLHTENKPQIFEASDKKLIIDLDVSSYYPAIIINNKKYPAHLGKEFIKGYKKMFEKRIEMKPLAKTDKKVAGVVGALKLAVNSVYGKSSDMQSWLYDRELTMFTTITGELSLMMLIEAFELKELHVISCNTDGVTLMIDSSQESVMNTISEWWCKITGFELERTDYKKIIMSSVNDYLAIKTNNELKFKGDYVVDFELYKNKSGRIIPIALREWFVNGTPVVQTIRHHSNIYDFCLRQKASRFFHYEGVRDGKVTVYNKLIRYYVSNSGEKIYKIKNPECTTNAPPKSQVEAGEWVCKVVNFLPKTTKVEDADINYDFYVEKAEAIIAKVDKTYKKSKKEDKQQLSLW